MAELKLMDEHGLVTLKMETDGVGIEEVTLTEAGWACHRELMDRTPEQIIFTNFANGLCQLKWANETNEHQGR